MLLCNKREAKSFTRDGGQKGGATAGLGSKVSLPPLQGQKRSGALCHFGKQPFSSFKGQAARGLARLTFLTPLPGPPKAPFPHPGLAIQMAEVRCPPSLSQPHWLGQHIWRAMLTFEAPLGRQPHSPEGDSLPRGAAKAGI